MSQASLAALVKEHLSSGKISQNYDNVHDDEIYGDSDGDNDDDDGDDEDDIGPEIVGMWAKAVPR